MRGQIPNRPVLSTILFALIVATVLIVSCASTAQGQIQKLYMPALQATDGSAFQLGLINPTLAEAKLTLTARNYAGAIIHDDDIANPVSLILSASSQKALRMTEIFGPGISRWTGWVEISASRPVQGSFFLVADSGLNFLNQVQLPTTPASRLIFPKLFADDFSSRLSLVNTSPQAVEGSISLYENDG